ncbi:MAG: hypothetical protein ACOY0T_28495 [Myxococcota bacterium]
MSLLRYLNGEAHDLDGSLAATAIADAQGISVIDPNGSLRRLGDAGGPVARSVTALATAPGTYITGLSSGLVQLLTHCGTARVWQLPGPLVSSVAANDDWLAAATDYAAYFWSVDAEAVHEPQMESLGLGEIRFLAPNRVAWLRSELVSQVQLGPDYFVVTWADGRVGQGRIACDRAATNLRMLSATGIVVAVLGDLIVCGDASGHISIVDAESGRKTYCFVAHEDALEALALGPDGLIASATTTELKVWRLGRTFPPAVQHRATAQALAPASPLIARFRSLQFIAERLAIGLELGFVVDSE